MIENAEKKEMLDTIKIYNNIKSYMLFKAFDFEYLKKYNIVKYKKLEEEIRIDADALYMDMLSEKFGERTKDYYFMKRAIYILLLKAICIEFTNSKKSPQNKVMELLDFVNEKMGVLMERELAVCYRYFQHHDKTKKFFKRIQKNNKSILATINGMTWDLVHIRIIESLYTYRPIDKIR